MIIRLVAACMVANIGIPESVADFIQDRASVTVGSVHYLAKTQQADTWYAKVGSKLTEGFAVILSRFFHGRFGSYDG